MVTAVLFDFYGTLAEATQWVSIDVVLAEHGYELPGDVRDRWWNDGIDGLGLNCATGPVEMDEPLR